MTGLRDAGSGPALPAGLTVRPAAAADLPGIVAMLADDRLGSQREDTSPDGIETYKTAFATIEADPCNTIWVAEEDGQLVGTFQTILIHALSYQGASRMEISAVRVAADRRGQGLGAALMRFAVAEARRQGVRIVQLTSNNERADAHRFYERLGFTRSHAGYKLDLHK